MTCRIRLRSKVAHIVTRKHHRLALEIKGRMISTPAWCSSFSLSSSESRPLKNERNWLVLTQILARLGKGINNYLLDWNWCKQSGYLLIYRENNATTQEKAPKSHGASFPKTLDSIITHDTLDCLCNTRTLNTLCPCLDCIKGLSCIDRHDSRQGTRTEGSKGIGGDSLRLGHFFEDVVRSHSYSRCS